MIKKETLNKLFPYLLLFALAFIFLFPLLSRVQSLGWEEWDQSCFFSSVPRDTLIHYHQFPLWNPYATGGRPLFANPETGILSPTFLIVLLFGCIIGLKIEFLITIFVGLVGMFLLSKYYSLKPISGIIMASLFGLSGYFALHIFAGHIVLITWVFLPYAVLFFLKSLERKKYLVFSAISLAFIVFHAGVAHVFAPVGIFLVTYAILLSIQHKKMLPIINLFLIFLLVFFISAIRIIPTLDYLSEHPRYTDANEKIPLNSVYSMLLASDRQSNDDKYDGLMWRWHEYGAYVGVVPLIFFLVGLILFFKKEYPLIISGFFSLAISLGSYSKYAPWPILHSLPFLNSLRVPSRFIILFIFMLAIIVGLTINYIYKQVEKRNPERFLLLLLISLIVLDLLFVNQLPYGKFFNNPPPPIERNTDFVQFIDTNEGRSGALSSMYYNFLYNKGTLNAKDPVPHQNFAKGFGNPNYTGEVFLENGGNASYRYWSPNKLVVNIMTANTTTLVINQNYDKGWRIEGGRKAESLNGLLSTTVSPQDKEITFYYLPTSFVIGTLITLLTVLGIVFVFWKRPKILKKVLTFLNF